VVDPVGVPQGTNLSPTIYDIGTTDLINYITNGTVITYADDSNAIVTGKNRISVQNLASKSANEFNSWCDKKRLISNSQKSVFIEFHKPAKSLDSCLLIKSNGTSLESVEHTIFLGLTIQNTLSWDLEVSNLIKKLNTANFAIFSIKNVVSQSTILIVYFAYFYSHVNLNIMFWGADEKNLEMIFKYKKKAVRYMAGLKYLDSCRGHFHKLNILTIPSVFIFVCAMFKRNYPNYYTNNNDIHKYQTRNCNKVVPKHKSKFFEKSPYYVSAKIYDNLPATLRNLNSDKLFRNLLKKILIFKEYYSYTEFFDNNSKIDDIDVLMFTTQSNLDYFTD
jgi:hypothetical protein